MHLFVIQFMHVESHVVHRREFTIFVHLFCGKNYIWLTSNLAEPKYLQKITLENKYFAFRPKNNYRKKLHSANLTNKEKNW